MTVHIDEMRSDVEVAPEAAPQAGAAPSGEDEHERMREVLERMRRDALRTASRGFDD